MYSKIIKELRIKNNISTDELSNYLGISKSLYYRYEKETEIFSIKHLIMISKYFSVSLDYIFGFVNISNYQNNKNIIDKKVFSKRLKKMRLSLNINQENIADILSISPSNISNYETGYAPISTLNLYILCKTFNISADYLLGKTDAPKTINVKEKYVKWKIDDTEEINKKEYIYSQTLIKLREKLNLKKEDLSKILNLPANKYGQYEKEYNIFPLKHINTICNYLDISIDYFLGLNSNEKYDNYKKEIDLKIQGNNLKALRKSLGLTMDKFAKNLDFNDSTIRNYELGKILISTKVLHKICKTYNVSADFLLGKIESPKERSSQD